MRDAEARQLRATGGQAISRTQAETLLSQPVDRRAIAAGAVALTLDEVIAEKQLRDGVTVIGARLPLEALASTLDLDELECNVLVLCAMVELDSEYERVVAYAQDDIGRRQVSIELASALTAGSFQERLRHRAALGEHGRLRRLGLVTIIARDSGARDELRLTQRCLDAIRRCA